MLKKGKMKILVWYHPKSGILAHTKHRKLVNRALESQGWVCIGRFD